MNNLLIFFALPLATIIIAVVLERIWNNYILVTLFTFAVYLIVAFAVGDSILLVLVIAYTFLAFIAAFVSMVFRKISKKLKCLENTESNTEETSCINNTQNYAINATVSPNSCNSGRTGSFRGQFRRRF